MEKISYYSRGRAPRCTASGPIKWWRPLAESGLKNIYQEEEIHETKDNEIVANDYSDCGVTGLGHYDVSASLPD